MSEMKFANHRAAFREMARDVLWPSTDQIAPMHPRTAHRMQADLTRRVTLSRAPSHTKSLPRNARLDPLQFHNRAQLERIRVSTTTKQSGVGTRW
jgi:hypothetical protein